MIATFIYPFIFSLFPALSLYINNFNEVEFSEVLFTCLLLLFYTACIFIGSLIVLREVQKTSLITFIFLFFIFSFGPVFSFIQKLFSFEELLGIYPGFVLLWMLVFLFSIIIVFLATYQIRIASKFLIFFSTFLLISSIIRLIALKPWSKKVFLNQPYDASEDLIKKGERKNNELPDIYYIIMDRYLGNNILKKEYEFDNSRFLNVLESNGFYVVENSHSNYSKTAHSFASSLNMEYINYLSENVGEVSSDWSPIYSLIKNNKVANTLKANGYKYIHIGGWWEPTRKNEIADVNVNLYTLSEFSRNLLRNTLFNVVYDQLFADVIQKEKKERSLYEIEYMKEVPFDEAPTYTFAHFLITHPPYVFDENGGYLDATTIKNMSEKEVYITQIKYANKLLEELVDEILTRSDKEPVIIIQSDEGKYPIDIIQFDHRYDWFKASDEDIEQKVSILNAIYIPNVDKNVFYPTITPVNTFRIVFNEIFDAGLDILPDETYLHQNNLNLYKFRKLE